MHFSRFKRKSNKSNFIITVKTSAGFTACAFLLSFRGYSYKGESEKRQQGEKIKAREGNGNERTQRNTAHGSKFRLFLAFSRLGGTLGRVQRLKANTSDFPRLHGSRLESSERLTDSARLTESGAGQERQPRTPRGATVLSTTRSTEIPRCTRKVTVAKL